MWSLLLVTLSGVCAKFKPSFLKNRTPLHLHLAQRGHAQMEEILPPSRHLGTPVSDPGTSGVRGAIGTSVGRLEGPGSGHFLCWVFSPPCSCWRASPWVILPDCAVRVLLLPEWPPGFLSGGLRCGHSLVLQCPPVYV